MLGSGLVVSVCPVPKGARRSQEIIELDIERDVKQIFNQQSQPKIYFSNLHFHPHKISRKYFFLSPEFFHSEPKSTAKVEKGFEF